MGRRSQAHRVLTLTPVWAQAKRQAEQLWAPAGFILAQVRAKWVAFIDPHDLAPEIFSLGRSAVTVAAAMVRNWARAWLGKRADMESEA